MEYAKLSNFTPTLQYCFNAHLQSLTANDSRDYNDDNDDNEMYQRHFIIPSSVSFGLHLPELVRVGLYDNTVSTAELVIAGKQWSLALHRQPLQQPLCQTHQPLSTHQDAIWSEDSSGPKVQGTKY